MNEEKMMITEDEAQKELKKGYKKAEILLKDEDKLEKTLKRLEEKLKTVPVLGEKFAKVPVMVSMVRSYIKKEYTEVPIGTIVAIVSAVIYIVNPGDIIPDVIPGVGHIDDAFVVAACLKLVESDIDEYTEWKEKNKK